MPRIIVIVALSGTISLVFIGMWRSWRSKMRRARTILETATVGNLGTTLSDGDALYVATTVAGRPFDRLALPGLAYRAKATITAGTNGLVIAPRGEQPIFVPVSSISSFQAATWTIDRVVERDGLIAMTWLLGGAAVDTYFRIVDIGFRARLVEACDHLVRVRSHRPDPSRNGE